MPSCGCSTLHPYRGLVYKDLEERRFFASIHYAPYGGPKGGRPVVEERVVGRVKC